MSNRAERRRAERESSKQEWQPHDPSVHQTLSTQKRLTRHVLSCKRCKSGSVGNKGCAWLANFYDQNVEELNSYLGVEPDGPVSA